MKMLLEEIKGLDVETVQALVIQNVTLYNSYNTKKPLATKRETLVVTYY